MQTALHHQNYRVEGVRCARCIHAIESALNAEDAITEARVNMSTNRLSISWEGDETLSETFEHKVESLGYHVTAFEETQKENTEDRFLLRCMAVSGFAMGNIMLISFALWSSEAQMMGLATRDLLHWISALIALPTIVYAGRPFFLSAISVLQHGRTNMDVPISLAITLACSMSLFETFHHGEHAYFDSAIMLLFFLLVGRWLDARARGKAQDNAQSLLGMMQGNATIIDGDTQRKVPISALSEDMLIRIAVGEKVPTDAEIVEGQSELDSSLITGESTPHLAKSGNHIYGGTLNLSAPLTARVLKASEDSLLADIIRLMEQAEQGRAHYVRLADKAAKLYTPIVHTLAAGAFIGWYTVGGMSWQDALLIAITTLIITCPCALGLAVPAVQVLTTSWLMKRGILVKSGDALERLAQIDAAAFDKTGTLTKGMPQLIGNYPDAELQLAASLAAHSNHPYSQAIVQAYGSDLLKLENIQEIAGKGLSGTYNGKEVFLGKPQNDEAHSIPKDGGTYIQLYQNGTPICSFHLKDPLREDSQTVISAFTQHHIDTHLLSGDVAQAVEIVAHDTGITHWQGNMKPQEKVSYIQSLQDGNHHVLMVGDGLNDAPALAQADISISPATGVDITQNSADIVFQGEKLQAVLQSYRASTFSTSLVKQNFALAVLYNCIAIPLALLGHVTPLIAAIAMSSSSLIVVANSFRINRLPEGSHT